MGASPLRNFSATQIEEAIAKALGDLAGSEFLVEVAVTKYVSSDMSELTGKAERVDLSISATQKQAPLDANI
jgi:hypothetical protein